MKNIPNKYRITYKVWEEDSHSGDWVKRTTDVDSLGSAVWFKNIVSIVPIYIEFGEPITMEKIKQAIIDTQMEKRLAKLK